jgi:hypothetical protein
MAIDLTPRWENFAVYLPAMQYPYASAVDSNKMLGDREFPASIKLTDLDFLNPKSKLWHYGYALYSAGQFTDARPTELKQQCWATVVVIKLAKAHSKELSISRKPNLQTKCVTCGETVVTFVNVSCVG